MYQILPQQDLARRFPQAATNGKLAGKSRWQQSLWPDCTQRDWGNLGEIGGDFPHLGGLGKADKGCHTLLSHFWKSQLCPCRVPMCAALHSPSTFVIARAV